MTWHPSRSEIEAKEAKRKAEFIAIYGEALWNQLEELKRPKPLSEREVMKPRKPAPENDRPALQTEDSEDPEWWGDK